MRELFMFNMITVDGFYAGPNGEIDWHNVDAEFNEFAVAQLQEIGGLLFGRVTYELMASYWPTEAAARDDPAVAHAMNSLPKVVFSRSLDHADWQNIRLVKQEAAQEIAALKQQPGKALALFGSGKLAAGLAPLGLIDEYRLMVNPVAFGSGLSLFAGLQNALRLRLASSRAFASGNVLLTYR